MSTHDSMEHKPDRVSLADEEGVKQVLVSSILSTAVPLQTVIADEIYGRRNHANTRPSP